MEVQTSFRIECRCRGLSAMLTLSISGESAASWDTMQGIPEEGSLSAGKQ